MKFKKRTALRLRLGGRNDGDSCEKARVLPRPTGEGRGEGAVKAAFTLAEVLITLGIIGIVAAMTMPTLMTNYKKKQTATQLQKAYTEILQAIKLSEVDNGPISGWYADASNVAEFTNKYFANYFKIVKRCFPTTFECFGSVKDLNGTPNTYLSTPKAKLLSFIAASGYSILYWIHTDGSGGWIYVDLDGPNKGPGTIGKDIFPFVMQFNENFNINSEENGQITEKIGAFPLGMGMKTPNTREDFINGTNLPQGIQGQMCNKNGGGGLCGALIMLDGWEIKEDYPW